MVSSSDMANTIIKLMRSGKSRLIFAISLDILLLLKLIAIPARMFIKNFDAPFTDKILVEYDNYMQQLQQGQQPGAPVQVPGANQQQAQMATQALMGNGQLFMRQQPQGPLTAYQPAA